MHRNSRVVAEALSAVAPDAEVRTLEDSTRTAVEAAAALGVPVGAIASSLVFMAENEPVLVITSGAHRVDLALVAATAELPPLRRATADEVRVATGQPIGGVAPVGHPRPIRTFVDVDLGPFPVVWAAAGTPHSVFATTFDQLVAITGGVPMQVAG